jgi:hypothetical protein
MRTAGKATLDDLPKGAIHPAMTRANAKSSKKAKPFQDHVAAFFRWADAGPQHDPDILLHDRQRAAWLAGTARLLPSRQQSRDYPQQALG